MSRPHSRDIVEWLTPYDLPISVKASPAALRRRASLIWNGDSLGLRPNRTPRSIARLRPSAVLANIIDRSNSANAPSTARISLP